MDPVTPSTKPTHAAPPIAADLFPNVDALASMPDVREPLEMPAQSFSRYDRRQSHKARPRPANLRVWLARLVVFGGALGLTAYGASEMHAVLAVGGVTSLEWVLLILFVVNFSWISLALTNAVVGLVAIALHRSPPRIVELTKRTAVVMPTYNEDPTRVFAALAAVIDDITDGPHAAYARCFDWFVLSDSTDADVWLAEERVFVELRRRLAGRANVYYRHRPKNAGRKAGNIADFIKGWGGAYDHMLVLDADSLMTSQAVIALALAMENDPDAGIIQTMPLIINRNTMFARLQQFAARFYGPVICTGLAAWSGRTGNYWGHNAIIRTRAFAEACGLPTLSGRPPLGGMIMSHDFVEAALIKRAGWAVYMLPHVRGSYEESPPNLIDLAIRDQRWCQGNLQHARVLAARGLRLISRQHLATGIFSYLASPIWMAQLLVGIVLVLQSHYVRPEYFTNEFQLLPAFPQSDPARALQLFGITMAVLLAPKLFGLALAFADRSMRASCGGSGRMAVSALIEIVFSALMAPILMVSQTGAVIRILLGMDSGWNPQRRDDGSVPFATIAVGHLSHTLLGFMTLIAGLLIAPSLVAWMSPTIAGLILAAVLIWGSGQLTAGLALRRAGLLLTPEETSPPAIAGQATRWRAELAPAIAAGTDGLRILHGDRELRELHKRFLPEQTERRRGEIDEARATASAKLADAVSIEEAVIWLKPAERIAVLLDRSLLDWLATLPGSEGSKVLGQ
jgi:membrane glycosyltransferase